MLFTDITFYLFTAVVLVLALSLAWPLARMILVAASYVFYGMAEPWYCLLLFTSTTVDYFAGQWIHSARTTNTRRAWLLFSMTVNLGLLGVFKYGDFTLSNVHTILTWYQIDAPSHLELLLPVGISFYTFQTLSYTIDVYRGKQTPTRDFLGFSLFVAFFPQLVSGPIERARDLLPQFKTRPRVTPSDIEQGITRILWGLTKKTVIADRLAIGVSHVYESPFLYSSPEIFLATLCFTFQLYLDFSAYTDIAIGTARLFGIRLSENFNYPLTARNPVEFWARWHMTLTRWFRDYVFFSLGGYRRENIILSTFNVMIVMTLVGLWHGASWNFVLFGVLNGAVLVGYMTLVRIRGVRRGQLLGSSLIAKWTATVLLVVTAQLMLIFFRSDSADTTQAIFHGLIANGLGWRETASFQLVLLALVITAHVFRAGERTREALVTAPVWVRGSTMAALSTLIAMAAVSNGESFIYFRF